MSLIRMTVSVKLKSSRPWPQNCQKLSFTPNEFFTIETGDRETEDHFTETTILCSYAKTTTTKRRKNKKKDFVNLSLEFFSVTLITGYMNVISLLT